MSVMVRAELESCHAERMSACEATAPKSWIKFDELTKDGDRKQVSLADLC